MTATVSNAIARAAVTSATTARAAVSAARTTLDEHSESGEFKRKDAAWRNWIKNGT